ncbi:MAG: biotin carboxylase N-terminal domain-containing protein [Legionellales bacterium]|jgi:3-methylcrotonyl-CoA carboxylase alpha subunit
MFKRLLIANRGEIACRIIKTAKKLNITTIAIYSEVDSQALYVSQADEAYAIDNYLDINKIIEVAQQVQVDAIHPGYGFLSENSAFAKACENAHIIFVGPSSKNIHDMGLKNEAKRLASQYGCPILSDDKSFPLLIKPIAGGGGKGMRIVWREQDFAENLASAKREALKSFANDEVIIEKYLTNPRHIEIQVLADKHQNAVYLFERDCSLQRRYQKIVEQAPALQLSQSLREKMGEAALNIVRGIAYVGAGTFEFLLDKDEKFYFMEMNTRLQVEHGVTELITGVDLVEQQLRVASGEILSFKQKDLSINGVAIEARLYAEDPSEDFLPSTGTIIYLEYPENARIDNGIQVGDKITIYYDPMLAKILVHADTHEKAWQKLSDALKQTHIAGLKTNLNFLRNLAQNPQITEHPVDTHYIDTHPELCKLKPVTVIDAILAALGIILNHNNHLHSISPWKTNDAWRLNAPALQNIILSHAQNVYALQVESIKTGYKITYEDNLYEIKSASLNQKELKVEINNQEYQRQIILQKNNIWLLSDEQDIVFTIPIFNQNKSQEKNENTLHARMPGKVVQVLVKEYDEVKADQALLVIEAMKMEHTLRAPHDGKIKSLNFQIGDQVHEGDVVLELD